MVLKDLGSGRAVKLSHMGAARVEAKVQKRKTSSGNCYV